MTIKDFLKKVILPVAAAWILLSILAPVCTEQGVCDWRKLLLFAGIPFGIHKCSSCLCLVASILAVPLRW